MDLPKITYDDINSIETFAKAVQQKTAFGSIPKKLTVGKQDIKTRVVTPGNAMVNPLGESDLRAMYSNVGKDIQLECAGYRLVQTPNALEHIVCVVGHEALHAIQYQFFTDDQIERASLLNKVATESVSAYFEYVGCDVELPAHAVMISLELRHSNPSDFDKTAISTSFYGYIKSRLDDSPGANELLQRIVESARDMHSHLRYPTSRLELS